MAFVFPEDKADFLAPNGVTYSWDGTKWLTKTFKADESVLEDYATEEWTEEKIADAMLDGTVALESYATIEYSDTKDASLQNQIDELGVTKGKVARYTVENTSGVPVSRTGQLAVNTSFAPNVNMVSFGIEDSDGVLTKPMADGDIIEFVDVASSQVSRYQITDATGAPTAIGVAYISGDNGFVRDEEEQVYIYPQNESGASKDYVDAQDATKVSKSGDMMSGPLTVQNSVLLSHDDGKQQLKLAPNHSDYFTNIYAYNGGGMRFRVAPENAETDYKTAVSIAYVTHTVDGNTYPVETAVNWLRNPTQPHHAANKAYVDANSGGGGGAIKLDLWTYKGPKSNGNGLKDGEFASKKLAGGVLELYLGRRNSRGVFYHPTPANSTAEYYHQVTQSSQNGSPLTITQQDGRCVWFAETKKLIFNKSTDNYSVIEAIHYRGAVDLLIEGTQYMLNIPGLIGPVSGW